MLRVKFWRIENVVLMKVLEQGEDTRGKLKFKAKNKFIIRSIMCPALQPDTLYIRGINKETDNEVHFTYFSGAPAAINFISQAKEAVAEYNALQKGAVIPTPDDVEITIAE